MSRLTWEIGGVEHEVVVDRFYPGSPSSYEDPGDGGEVELSNFVKVWRFSDGPDYVTWDTFIIDLAIERGDDDLDHLSTYVHDCAFEAEHERRAELDDDRSGWYDD